MKRFFPISNPPRRSADRTGVLPVVCVVLLVISSAAPSLAQGITRQGERLQLALDTEKSAVMDVSSDVWCSEVFLGTGMARISWASAEKSASPGDRAEGISVEITMYPGGFDNDKFASYEAKLATTRAGESPAKAVVDAPPLEKGSSYVVIRDLQPGVLYRWRLAGPADSGKVASEALEFRGPICPVDSEMGAEPGADRSRSEVQR